MTKEELIDFLKDNLSVRLYVSSASYSGNDQGIEVELYLNDQMISRDYGVVNIPDD